MYASNKRVRISDIASIVEPTGDRFIKMMTAGLNSPTLNADIFLTPIIIQ